MENKNIQFFDDLDEFSFSKKFHTEFFKSNKYYFELLNKSFKDSDLYDYQTLLIYSFILQNIPIGSKILEIGNSNSAIFKKIHENYECWEIKDVNVLKFDYSIKNNNIPIRKYHDEIKFSHNSINYFDFVFSISAFENIPYDNTGLIYSNIIFNLNKFTKSGGYSLHCFEFYLSNESNPVNSFFYYFFKDSYFINKTLNDYSKLRSISLQSDLLSYDIEDTDSTLSKIKRKLLGESKKVVSYNIFQKKIYQLSKTTKTKTSDFLKKNPAYIFHHLMKCGGTSMAISLKKWFFLEDEFMYKKGEVNNFEINTFIKFKLNLDNVSSDTCIRGHYHDDGYYLHQRYPEALERNVEFKIFTFIRDPLQLRISLYYYLKNLGIYYNDISLETSLSSYNNFIASRFPCNESNYEKFLSRYFFIGIVEFMQESFDKLATIINKKKILLPIVNTSEKDSKINELTPEFIEKFKQNNKLDYLIYNYGLDKFNSL